MRPPLEIADIISRFKDSFEKKFHPNPTHMYILEALEKCRTSSMGGHVDKCDTCGHTHISYNSCRNRHCPKCGGIQRENWIMQRKEECLPVKYFHVVFTVSQALNGLFPVKALSRVFRAKFFSLLDKSPLSLDAGQRKRAFDKDWVVYAKHPLHGANKVVEYIGRYSHRTAITNNRLISLEAGKVTFRYKDYRDEGKQKEMTVTGEEFLRRFTLHMLPAGFVRIRHYGFLSPASRKELQALQLFFHVPVCAKKKKKKDWKEVYRERFGCDPDLCPVCKKGKMITVSTLSKERAPPLIINYEDTFTTKKPAWYVLYPDFYLFNGK